MADATLTTVVVINHNYGRFVAEAVASVLRQTRVPALLVIDDASTDDSATVLSTLEVARPAIEILRLDQNIGLSRVRNLAAARAVTQWLLFLDADDWIEPTYIERAEARAARSPESDVIVPDMTLIRDGRRPRVVPSQIPDHWRGLLERNTIVQASVVRRALVNQLGGYDAALDFEDWDFWVRALKAGARFARLPGAYVNRREHGSNKGKMCDEAAAVAAVRAKHGWRPD